MNIGKEISFTIGKPSLLPIRKSETVNIFAVGLLRDQVLAKHKTQTPALLVLLQGSILFRINSESVTLSTSDTYQIPPNTEHEVIGLDEKNIFLIVKEMT